MEKRRWTEEDKRREDRRWEQENFERQELRRLLTERKGETNKDKENTPRSEFLLRFYYQNQKRSRLAVIIVKF